MIQDRPVAADLRLAAEWLDQYEGEDAHQTERVASWLRARADRLDLEDSVRRELVARNLPAKQYLVNKIVKKLRGDR